MGLKAIGSWRRSARTLALATAARAAVINGTPGDDCSAARGQADEIHAFAGNDTVYARDGADLVRAGLRQRRVRAGDGSDLVVRRHGLGRGLAAANGPDRLYGGSDADTSPAATATTALAGNKGDDVVSGGNGTTRSSAAGARTWSRAATATTVLHALAADGQDSTCSTAGRADDEAYRPPAGAAEDARSAAVSASISSSI